MTPVPRRLIAATALALVLAAGAVRAAGEYAGQVLFNGLPVPGATVIATQGERTMAVTTNEEGVYRFAELPEGAWTLRLEMVGFAAVTREIQSGDTMPVPWDVTLLPFEELAKTIPPPQPMPAATAAAQGQAARPQVGTPAPAPARGFERAAVNAAARPATAAPIRAEDATPAETAQAADSLVINGSVNNGAASPFAQPAAFGNNRRRPGALYNGTLGVLGGNSAWDARPYSFTSTPAARPDYSDVHMLGTFGGPLKIPGVLQRRPNFFVGFQRTLDNVATAQSTVVPTALERAGNFSQSRDAFGQPVTLTDPATGQPFAGNTLPQDQLSPQAAALLRYYPQPNLDDGGRFNYQSAILAVTRQASMQSRLTQPINQRNQLLGTLAMQRTTSDNTSLFGFENQTQVSTIDAGVTWTRRFNQFLSMRPRYQFTQATNEATPFFSNLVNVSGEAGIAGNDQTPVNWGPPSLIFTSGVENLADGRYSYTRTRAHTGAAEGYWTRARHNFTFGGEGRFAGTDILAQQDPRGRFSFTGATTGSALADFLIGRPQTASIAIGNADKLFRSASYALYLTDDLRLSPSFTVNLGVRWEYEAPFTEALGRLVNLDLSPDFATSAQVLASNPTGGTTGREFASSLIRPDKRGIQPRTALAWRPVPGSSLVVRAGYGIYRNTNVYQSLALQLAQQPPLSRTFAVETSAATPLTLATGLAAVSPAQAVNTYAIDPNLRVGAAHNWQASVQRDLPGSLTVTATYLGTKGTNLLQQLLPNTYPAGAANPCPQCPAGFIYLTSGGSSTRHAGQVQLRRRLRNGLTWNTQYVLAKAEDNATAFNGVGTNGASIAQNWLDLDAEWGPSSFDQRHKLTAEVQYTTGVGVAGGGLLTGMKGALVKGWTFTSTMTAGSALPVTPIYQAQVPGTGIIGSIRASETGAATGAPDGYYFNPTAFAIPVAGTWGTAGRNSLRGPAQFQLNAGVTRSFAAGSRINLDWRLDAVNILNRITYSGVGTLVGTPQFGLPIAANQMRKLQTSLRMRF